MTISSQNPSIEQEQTRFIPLLVRFLTPLNLVVVLIAMVGAFVLANSLGGNVQEIEQTILVQNAVSVAQAGVDSYDRLRSEAQRIAFTQGIAEAVQNQDEQSLQNLLTPLALSANLDSVIVTDASGQEIIGLLRSITDEAGRYSLSRDTNLAGENILQDVLNNATVGASGLIYTENGLAIYVAVPARVGDTPIGTVLAGWYVRDLLADMQGGNLAEVSLYAVDGTLLETTLDIDNNNQSILATNPQTMQQALSQSGQVTLAENLSLNALSYRAGYFPFSFGEQTLGIASVLMADNVAYATAGGRTVSAILMAVIAGAVTFVVIVGINILTRRVEQITETAQALTRGERVRVNMQASDEIGQAAVALNQYADSVTQREDQFRQTLRRQRRERDYLLLVFESIPEGIIVQDVDGRVLLMNDIARELLGSQRVFRSAGLHELTDVAHQLLGALIAPGLYTLGDPKRIKLDEKILLVQASAIVGGTETRLGSVVLLRNITDDVRREQAREEIMSNMVSSVQEELQSLSQKAMDTSNSMVRRLARDVAKYASSLQTMIVEMRELTQYSPQQAKQIQRALSVDTLIWAVANDWRQIARAADLTLSVIFEARGLFVLGDEQRLRWAIGNIVDNAIKYTPAGGKLSLEIRGEDNGLAQLRVRDSGVGIHSDDLPQVFTRFYRGNPLTQNGEAIHAPGMGQGLTDSQQIISSHGGQIRVKSKLYIGTAVYIALPTTASESYVLPLLDDDVMEGETMLIPTDVSVDAFWGRDDEL